jgi:monoterpene epsilon-lactone hydrolase
VIHEVAEVAGVRVERLVPAGVRPERHVVYAHGGGYVLGAPSMGAALGAELARRLRATWVGVDYRLAPEHPAPAQRDDVAAVILALEGEVAAVGDSAGAGALVAALALGARPRALALLSPWLDLATGAGDRRRDPLLTGGWLAACVSALGIDPTDPAVSPLRDLPALVPTLVVGTDEDLLAGDGRALAVHGAELDEVPGLYHDFALMVGRDPAADAAARRIAAFLAAAAHWADADTGWVAR